MCPEAHGPVILRLTAYVATSPCFFLLNKHAAACRRLKYKSAQTSWADVWAEGQGRPIVPLPSLVPSSRGSATFGNRGPIVPAVCLCFAAQTRPSHVAESDLSLPDAADSCPNRNCGLKHKLTSHRLRETMWDRVTSHVKECKYATEIN